MSQKGFFKRPAKTGRPTTLTPAVQDKIIKALAAGAYIETAVAYAGVGKTNFYEWLKKGAKYDAAVERGETPVAEDEIYAALRNAVEKTMAESELGDLILIARAAQMPQFWTAAAWRLERKFPQRYGQNRQPDDMSDGDNDPLKKLTDAITDARRTQQKPAGDVEGGEG